CAAALGAQSREPNTGIEFVRVEPGEFIMGCSIGDSICGENEKPAHRVRITKAFEIGKYEVTQGQWEAVMGTTPSRFRGTDLPVESVTWNDVERFLRKMTEKQDGY